MRIAVWSICLLVLGMGISVPQNVLSQEQMQSHPLNRKIQSIALGEDLTDFLKAFEEKQEKDLFDGNSALDLGAMTSLTAGVAIYLASYNFISKHAGADFILNNSEPMMAEVKGIENQLSQPSRNKFQLILQDMEQASVEMNRPPSRLFTARVYVVGENGIPTFRPDLMASLPLSNLDNFGAWQKHVQAKVNFFNFLKQLQGNDLAHIKTLPKTGLFVRSMSSAVWGAKIGMTLIGLAVVGIAVRIYFAFHQDQTPEKGLPWYFDEISADSSEQSKMQMITQWARLVLQEQYCGGRQVCPEGFEWVNFSPSKVTAKNHIEAWELALNVVDESICGFAHP
ncbi:MAG: hypothetical protein R3A11_04625 [Bdellovibrionota bacterium]